MAAKITADITKQARELQRALQSDLALARKMLCVLNAQTEALIVNDARSVAMMERHCREMVKEQEEGDRLRSEAVTNLAKSLNIQMAGGGLPILSELALQLPLAEARAILALRREILATHEHMRRANERNRVLLENALSCIETTLDTIRQFAFKPAGYGVNPNTLMPATLCLNQAA